MTDDPIQRVRRFNRAVTRRIGILGDDYLGSGRPWGEARLLFEIGPEGADVRQLRERLSLDSGYLSRLLRSLEAQKMVASRASDVDARVRHVKLTRKGLNEWKRMETRSDDVAQGLLAPLGAAQRQRLLAAMADVEHLLRASAVAIEPADPTGVDARACLDAYAQELTRRFANGFDPSRGPTVDRSEVTPPRGQFLLARLDGAAIGCIALKTIAPGFGEIKRMWVDPAARGLSVARRLLAAIEAHAADLGLRTLRLDTNATQTEAISLYRNGGYRVIDAYNDNPYADLWFEKRISRAPTVRATAPRKSR